MAIVESETTGSLIAHVDLGQRYVLLVDGQVLPITDLVDDEGDPTEVLADAVHFVAGEGSVWIDSPVWIWDDEHTFH